MRTRFLSTIAATLTTAVAGVALAATASAAPVNPTQLDTPFHFNNESGYTLQQTSWNTRNDGATMTLPAHTNSFLVDDVSWFAGNSEQDGTYKVVGTPYTVVVETNPAYGADYSASSRCGIKDASGHWAEPTDFTCVGNGTQITLGTPVTWDIAPSGGPQTYFTLSTGTSVTTLRDQGGFAGWYDGSQTVTGDVTLTTVAGVHNNINLYSNTFNESDYLTVGASSFADGDGWVTGNVPSQSLMVTPVSTPPGP